MNREELAAALAAAASSPGDYPQDRFDGRGIVICAGGARLFTCAWICIGMLRRLGCALPIEVWHLGPEEMSGPMRGLLAEQGAETVDAHEVAKRHAVRRLGGWELKPYALLHSRFREVLLLDADNVPVSDPSGLLDSDAFRTNGAVFWPDLLRLSRSNPIWTIARLEARDCASFESGQILLDKARCWRALSLAHWMNQHSEHFYDVIHGDKDTFLIAWLMLAQSFHLIPHHPKQLAATICQRGPDGMVLFQHRNGAKWILRGVNPAIEGFRREAECFALLADLGKRWDGYVFSPPTRSPSATTLEGALAGRRFRYVRVSSDERIVELLPDHRIGGAGGDEFYWYVDDSGPGPEIVLAGNGAIAARLALSTDGVWRGRLVHASAIPVEMVPTESAADCTAPVAGRERNVLHHVLDRALVLYESLPRDGEATRDLVGLLRSLARLDPSIRQRLDALAADTCGGKRRQMVAQALEGWPDNGNIEAGHGWQRHSFPVIGYDPTT